MSFDDLSPQPSQDNLDYTEDDDGDVDIFEHEKQVENDTKCYDEPQLIREWRDQVHQAKDLLHMGASAACRVLRHFEFNFEKLRDRYFDCVDQTDLLKKLGVEIGAENTYEPLDPSLRYFDCPTCFDSIDVSKEEVFVLSKCKHGLCSSCWGQYLTNAVYSGPNCVTCSCPVARPTQQLRMVECTVAIDDTMFQKFCTPDVYEKFTAHLLRSFVNDSKHIKWCPRPGCQLAIQCNDTSKKVVTCRCGCKVCFSCNNEAHAPATCQELSLWLTREKGESDNLKWITVNTRPCPGCKRPTERSQGCNHMQHCPCKLHWCFECGQPWDDGKHLNFWYNCPYKDLKDVKDQQIARAAATSELYEYAHCYEGYCNHERIRKFNNDKDLKQSEEYKRKLEQHNSGVDADFITDAVKALIDARTYVKYAYVYSYYRKKTMKEERYALFMFNVKNLEDSIIRNNNMLEDLFRYDPSSRKDPPHTRSQMTDAAQTLRKKLDTVMQGCIEDE